jgi:hypothetical protein
MEVRRLLDPDHVTKLDQLGEAADALGGGCPSLSRRRDDWGHRDDPWLSFIVRESVSNCVLPGELKALSPE